MIQLLLNYNGIDINCKDESDKIPIELTQNEAIKLLFNNSS